MVRIALGIEYDGHGFYGFQAQPNLLTIQGCLQEAISKIANEPIYVHCAGRTDAGVHASGQVVHFDTHAKRHIDAWIWGVNAYLPKGIAVKWARHVDFHFHARFKATHRRYRYIIYNHPVRPAILSTRVSWHYYALNENLMREAAACLIGEHDFSSFRAAECQSRTPVRKVTHFEIERRGDFILFEIEANAFLQHMVRNIAGSLMNVGSGLRSVSWMQTVLDAKDRRQAGVRAPAEGLTLIRVVYPEPYTFPVPDQLFLV
ncbi:MAG TPA: tRNA pseudouridine(38-40) synthase TruA [Gammaproteobacteria bacterium]|nr:tRNA pseudouridine(38-40) synthase TruA [Gammaproteobacteria bacterium]